MSKTREPNVLLVVSLGNLLGSVGASTGDLRVGASTGDLGIEASTGLSELSIVRVDGPPSSILFDELRNFFFFYLI